MHHLRNVGGRLALDEALQRRNHGSGQGHRILALLAPVKMLKHRLAADVFVRHFLSVSSSSDTPGKTILVSQRSTHRFSQYSRQ
jgi:hypothetical protein